MSCSDIPSLLDLQNTKKHVDDFGRLMGTGTGTSTNGVTGQVRPTYNSVLANLGYTRVGTFATGATLLNGRQTLLWDVADGGDGQEYGWSGSFPPSGKVVPPGSTPDSTGGIGDGKWVSRFDPALRTQVLEVLRRSYAEAGYNVVGTFQGGFTIVNANDVGIDETTGKGYTGPAGPVAAGTDPTSGGFVDVSGVLPRDEVVDLQINFDKLNNKVIAGLPTSVVNTEKKSLLMKVPRDSQNETVLKEIYGYTSIYPQGISVDDVTGEFFILYHVAGGPNALLLAWVDIYNSNFTYTGKSFGIRSSFPQGLIVGYVNGQRKVAHQKYNNTDFLQITNIPSTNNIVNLSVYEPTLVSEITTEASVAYYGEFIAIMSPLSTNQTGFKYGIVRIFDKVEALSVANPAIKKTIYLPLGSFGGGDSGFRVRKPQGIALSPSGISVFSGYQYNRNNYITGDGGTPAIYQYGWNGEVLNQSSFSSEGLDAYLTNNGFVDSADIIEPEGCCYTKDHGLITSMIAGLDVIICAEGVAVDGCELLDYSQAYLPSPAIGSQLANVNMTRGINQVTNASLETADAAADYALLAGISSLTFQLTESITFTVAGKTFSNGKVSVENIDGNFLFIYVQSNSGSYEFRASGATPRNWTMHAQITGGANVTNPAPLGSIVQRAAQGFAQDRYVVSGANTHTAQIFSNVANGTIGSIGMSATGTSFNTTSDERLKEVHGHMDNPLSLVTQMVTSGALQLAAFKSAPDEIRPMALAQQLYKIYPHAVTPGSGEIGDDDFIPWQVDYSQLIPLLIMAIAQLSRCNG